MIYLTRYDHELIGKINIHDRKICLMINYYVLDKVLKKNEEIIDVEN